MKWTFAWTIVYGRSADFAVIHAVTLDVSFSERLLQERTQVRSDAGIGRCHRLELLSRQPQLNRQPEKVDQLAVFRTEQVRTEYLAVRLVHKHFGGSGFLTDPIV